jgi:hypothetical protein
MPPMLSAMAQRRGPKKPLEMVMLSNRSKSRLRISLIDFDLPLHQRRPRQVRVW